ncbi:MAG: hypothetical protein JXR41_01675, partial [Bacteroidales bacterium]|nr:hypothetical protein [Bacteroidales bacterium]
MEQGLLNNKVNAVCRDNDGFMWFGTNEGLNRFDGYQLKSYHSREDDITSINNDLVRYIIVDSEKRLWIATDGGTALYDRERDAFKRIRYKNDQPLSEVIWEIVEIGRDSLLLASSAGLFLLDGRSLTAENVDVKYGLSDNTEVSALCKDLRGNIYIGTLLHGIFVYDGKLGESRHYKNIPGDRTSLSANRIECISEDQEGNIWIGTFEDGLNFFDPDGSVFEWIDLDRNENFNIRVRDIVTDRFGRLWVGTYKGLYLKEDGSRLFTLYAHNRFGISEITHNSIYDICIDKHDIMWIGTYSGGVNYCDFNQKKIKQYTFSEDDNEYLSDFTVFAITKDKNNNLWLGTEKAGLGFFNINMESCEFNVADDNDQFFSGTNIKCLTWGENDDLWIGTYMGGLRCYSLSTKTLVKYTHDKNDSNSLANDVIYAIEADKHNNLWVGTREGIDMLPHRGDRFIHYKNDPGELYGLGRFRVVMIYKDNEDNIYAGGARKGLFVLNSKKNTFVLCHKKMADYYILTMYKDDKGQIWAGSDKGLLYLDTERDSLILYTDREGLPTRKVTAILADNTGNLWISTANGLVKFSNAVNTPHIPDFKVFKADEGLNIIQFSDNSCYKSPSGELFFGGVNGFLSFQPYEIINNYHLPEVKITGLKILNKNVEIGQKIDNHVILKKAIFATDEVTLYPRYHVVTFEFTALHYSNPEGNKYAYMLEGFDKEWNFTGSGSRFATYSNLPGRRYVFKVKASNNDGFWNEIPTELSIKVVPPFWKTWWFIAGMISLTIGMVVLFFRYRVYSINQQKTILQKNVALRTSELSEANTLLEEKQEEIIMQNEELAKHRNHLEELVAERTAELENARRKAEEADRLKSAFLANMSHEIRTPMNAIVGFSNLLLTDDDETEKEDYVRIINNNCENLMVLINDILDVSLIEANQLKINPVPFDANLVLNELESVYKHKSKPELKIQLIAPVQRKFVLITDQHRFRQILNNLLSNAIKYTEKGGIKFGYEMKDDHVLFYVSDSGIGIDKDDFERIFDYFHKLENSSARLYKGTGIGLSISKKLVELLGGKIWLESEPGNGTTFFFTIPLTQTPDMSFAGSDA